MYPKHGWGGGGLRLSGIGVKVSPSTLQHVVSGADSSDKVLQALQHLFPDAANDADPHEPHFGQGSDEDWQFLNPSMTHLPWCFARTANP